MGNSIVLRNRDIWRMLQVTLKDILPYLQKFTAPGGTHSSSGRWIIRTAADEKWVKGDPLMLQMIHDMANLVETRACFSIVQPMLDSHILTGLKKRTLESLNKEERRQVLDTLAFNYNAHDKHVLEDAENEINGKVKKYYLDLQTACSSYRNYKIKEGFGLTTKFVSLFGGAVFTGVGLAGTISTMGAGAGLGLTMGGLGIVNCLQNAVEIAEQLVRLGQEAEQMQQEINIKLSLLERKHKALSGQPGKVLGAIAEGAIFATLLKGTEGIIGISFKALGDLIERYGSKINGMDQKCHALARNLDVLLKQAEMADKEFNSLSQEEFRKEFERFLNKINSSPGRWDWLKKSDPVVQARKIIRAMNCTRQLFNRIQEAHKVHAGYQARIDALSGAKAKTAYEWSRLLTGGGWTLMQIGFGLTGGLKIEVFEMVQTILGATNDIVTGPGFDVENFVLDKLLTTGRSTTELL